ncbi:unnamed protein product [Didymodactylos carnosus]|uniref:tRNA-5-taurinomethyluridine 2-sulfurtransferase n=1 Tax=Didymodactylos carnosus TaxID=1234261 RepID=A0A814NAD8_9BILA|nr:unnamed protein product [Didymodactylos carnosus]CAF1088986.1 unnamed protein product [Didymodactylos carnosus]CAF3648369.1 unnamed protein product [Didymodactylos carnosus]CAF3854419.1 unnamed protein product [Didymodactylos carnosus]
MSIHVRKRIICAISGGIDSAVSALLLKKKGYDVIGCFMKNWDKYDDNTVTCTLDKDLEDAEYVCRKLQIKLHVVDFVKQYWNKVFIPFLDDYQNGLTPNPDILCNKYVKFDALLTYCKQHLQTELLATGHYDINYALKYVQFPVGDILKSDVKKIALENSLERFVQKRESMGICFIGKRKFHVFIDQFISELKGDIRHIETNNIIGEHKGIHRHTLGQRIPIYDRQHAPGTNHPALFTQHFHTDASHWIDEIPYTFKTNGHFECDFKFQHRHKTIVVQVSSSSPNNTRLKISLPIPIRSISPGQYAVFYNGEECLGGARIIDNGTSLYELKHSPPLINSDRLLNKY